MAQNYLNRDHSTRMLAGGNWKHILKRGSNRDSIEPPALGILSPEEAQRHEDMDHIAKRKFMSRHASNICYLAVILKEQIRLDGATALWVISVQEQTRLCLNRELLGPGLELLLRTFGFREKIMSSGGGYIFYYGDSKDLNQEFLDRAGSEDPVSFPVLAF